MTKIIQLVALILLLGNVTTGIAREFPRPRYSSIRHPWQHYIDAAKRYVYSLGEGYQSQMSAMGAAKPLAELDLPRIPEWKLEPLFVYGGFRFVRDLRFLKDPEKSQFMRRSSWMYPDDGCFARAELMAKNLQESGYGSTAKAFIFGNLTVKSTNAIGGSVSWWYHVVPVFRVVRPTDQANAVMVFDPAIEPRAPLNIQTWVSTMTADPASVKIAICDQNTYVPSDECYAGNPKAIEMALSDQMTYLTYERQRLTDLGRNPENELGNLPPWSAPAATSPQVSRR